MMTSNQPKSSPQTLNNNNTPRTTNTLIYSTLDSSAYMRSAIFNLQQRIQQYAKTNRVNQLQYDILSLAVQALNLYQQEQSEDKQFDLHVTVNMIFNIIATTKEDELEKQISAFLSEREELLSGDSHDYCYATSLANEFCYHLVKIVFPNVKSPNNILFKNTITKDRSSPWQNLLEMENDLPIACGDFFRTSDHKIQLYDGILTQAIEQLKRGYADLAEIWQNTDPALPANTPLTSADLAILKQRSPTFSTLVTYTEKLDKEASEATNGGLYERFVRLIVGMKRGNPFGDARNKAYQAIQEFAEWWNNLDNTETGKEIKQKIRSHYFFLTKLIRYYLHMATAPLRQAID